MPENYTCGKCGKVAKTKQALERHAAYHEDERPFSCEVCLQRFKNSDDRGKHYRRLKKDEKFNIACTVCHKHFKTQEVLKKHTEMLGCRVSPVVNNTNEDAIPSKSTNHEGSLVTVKEEIIPGDEISCTCKICETEFVNTKHLKRHYKEVHNDTKRQVCIQCGQTLSSKDSLARHFSIFHQTSFPFSCDVCNQKFKIKESLCRHVKFVHQDGGYQCTECNRVFTQPVNLKKHLAVHSKQKEYSCRYCRREFRWKQALQKHESLHRTEYNSTKVTEEANTEFDIDLDIIEITENKTCDRNDIIDVKDVERIVIEDVTDEDIGRQLKDVADKSLGRKLMFVDKSLEQTNNVNLDQYSKDSVKNIISCNTVIKNDIESTPDPRKENMRQSFTVSRVSDEYTFQCEEENNILGMYNCPSDRIKHTPTRKRTCNNQTDFSHAKKKSKSSIDLDQGEGMPVLEGNDDKISNSVNASRELDDSAYQKNGVSLCSEDSQLEILTDNVAAVNHKNGNRQYADIHTFDTSSAIHDKKGHESEIFNNGTKLKKLKYLSLTSCPTTQIQDAPELVFKPSSIQNILAKAEVSQTKIVTATNENDFPAQPSNRKSAFKFPVSCIGSPYTKLHNPFVIPNYGQKSTSSTVVSSSTHITNIKDASSNEKDETAAMNKDETSTTVTAPREHSVPSGKFSLVKHMLSLQNEENFDKAMFENPLYSKPADIKDFELMAERHKVVDKSGDSIIQYDLSAKQNIPFHWLGMSVAKNKIIENSDIENVSQDNGCEAARTTRQSSASRENCYPNKTLNFSDAVSEETMALEITKYCQSPEENTTIVRKSSGNSDGQVQRSFQAIKSLIANSNKNDGNCEPQNGKSVLSNPFDYQNKQFQDDRSDSYVHTPSSQSSTYTKRKPPLFYNPVSVADTIEGNKVLYNLNSAAYMDMSRNEDIFVKPSHYKRQHSFDSSSSAINAGFTCPRNLSGSLVASNAVSSAVSFYRSSSTPSYSDCNRNSPKQWPWVPDSISAENYMVYHSSTESFDSVRDIPTEKYGECSDLENLEFAVNRNADTSCENGGNISRTDRKSDREIDLSMTYKNIAQLERLNGRTFDRDQLKGFFTKQDRPDNTRPHLNKIECPQTTEKPLGEMSHEISSHGDWVSCFSRSVNHFSQAESIDIGFDEARKFDAFNMIDSSFGTSYAQLPVSANSGKVIENNNSDIVRTEVQSVHRSSEITDLTLSSRTHHRNGESEKRNGSVCDIQRAGRNMLSGDRCTGQQERHKKLEVSIFDMLRLVQEGKGKENDNIETLLGAYV